MNCFKNSPSFKSIDFSSISYRLGLHSGDKPVNFGCPKELCSEFEHLLKVFINIIILMTLQIENQVVNSRHLLLLALHEHTTPDNMKRTCSSQLYKYNYLLFVVKMYWISFVYANMHANGKIGRYSQRVHNIQATFYHLNIM